MRSWRWWRYSHSSSYVYNDSFLSKKNLFFGISLCFLLILIFVCFKFVEIYYSIWNYQYFGQPPITLYLKVWSLWFCMANATSLIQISRFLKLRRFLFLNLSSHDNFFNILNIQKQEAIVGLCFWSMFRRIVVYILWHNDQFSMLVNYFFIIVVLTHHICLCIFSFLVCQ